MTLPLYYLNNTFGDHYYGYDLTKNKGLDCILQQNNNKIWKLNLETKLSWKQKYEFGNTEVNLETNGGQTYV